MKVKILSDQKKTVGSNRNTPFFSYQNKSVDIPFFQMKKKSKSGDGNNWKEKKEEREKLYGKFDEIFVSAPDWSGIKSKQRVYFIKNVYAGGTLQYTEGPTLVKDGDTSLKDIIITRYESEQHSTTTRHLGLKPYTGFTYYSYLMLTNNYFLKNSEYDPTIDNIEKLVSNLQSRIDEAAVVGDSATIVIHLNSTLSKQNISAIEHKVRSEIKKIGFSGRILTNLTDSDQLVDNEVFIEVFGSDLDSEIEDITRVIGFRL